MKYYKIPGTAIRLGVGACLVIAMAAFGGYAFAQTPAVPSTTTVPDTFAETPSPAPTPAATEPPARVGSQPPSKVGEEPTVRMHMPDGQLISHMIRVYVTRVILPSQNPRLRLLRSHAVSEKAVDEAIFQVPGLIAPNQEWIETVDGQQVRHTGTLLLFDLNNIDVGYKAMLRVLPVVSWTEGDTEQIVVGAHEVNVGNILAVIGWTLLVVLCTLLMVMLLSWRKGGSPIFLLVGVDGHLSLAQTQIAFWTIAVGGIVLGYGLIKLYIPEIPTSLLALMGASLVTGGIGYFKDAENYDTSKTEGVLPVRRSPAMGDLIRVFPPGKVPELSLAKAQMLFWTVLLLVLFVSKSLLDGAIWAVPWELVALMGFSQAGYLAPKLAPKKEDHDTEATAASRQSNAAGGSQL